MSKSIKEAADNDKQIIKRLTEELEEQQEQIRRLTFIIEERDQKLEGLEKTIWAQHWNNPAVAAIQYALYDDECKTFLQLWNDGKFDVLREEWDNVPDEVFDGADPLHGS